MELTNQDAIHFAFIMCFIVSIEIVGDKPIFNSLTVPTAACIRKETSNQLTLGVFVSWSHWRTLFCYTRCSTTLSPFLPLRVSQIGFVLPPQSLCSVW